MRYSTDWKDYELIDCSCGEKLERWTREILVRPDPQVIWKSEKEHRLWFQPSARYVRSKTGGGKWQVYKHIPSAWQVRYKDLTFNIKTMGFKHTGLFPEQAVNWDFTRELIKNSGRSDVKVLNLFDYTGAAIVACLKEGASVVHVDASKGMTQWAKENAQASGVADGDVRWIVDDCMKFVKREIRRENNYDIIILYNDISQRNQNLIKMSSKTNVAIRFVRVSDYFDEQNLFVDQHLSIETYYRLIIPEIMPDYHKILYLDCDMVVDCDVADLYEENLNGMIVGASKDIDVAGQLNLNQNNWKEYAKEILELDSPYDYFQAGVLVIDLDELRKIATSKKMIQLAVSKSFRCHDQDVLNIICKNKVRYLSQRWNTLMDWREVGRCRMDILKMAPRKLFEEYSEARKKPCIVHFAGYQKPWDVADCDFSEYFWKYASDSPYYTRLIYHIRRCLEDEVNVPAPVSQVENLEEKESFVRRLSVVLFPYKSRRREILKKVVKKFIHI